jgi:hypothetical protein
MGPFLYVLLQLAAACALALLCLLATYPIYLLLRL